MTVKPLSTYRFYLLAGLVSSLICTLGGFILPEDSLALNVYPGFVLATVLFFVYQRPDATSSFRQVLRWLVLTAMTVAGWRLAIEVAVMHQNPLPFTLAGATGAAVTSIALTWAWGLGRSAPLFFLMAVIAGAVGGALFGFVDSFVSQSQEVLWTLLLFSIWQIVFIGGLFFALNFVSNKSAANNRHS